MRLYFLCFSTPVLFALATTYCHAQPWQAEISTGWTSSTDRAGLVIYDNIHVGISVSRSVTPHWRASGMYLLQGPQSDYNLRTSVSNFRIHNLSAGMIYEEPDERHPNVCLFGGWLAGVVLYDSVDPAVATESQPVINTVMGFRGHIRPRVGYKIQGLFLAPIFSDRDRLFGADLWLGAGPILCQIAANAGISYAF